MTASHIRPLAICIFRSNDRILVIEGYDSVKKQTFYRPLGGGINFGESSSAALVREIHEEIAADVADLEYLGTLENIFRTTAPPGTKSSRSMMVASSTTRFMRHQAFLASRAMASQCASSGSNSIRFRVRLRSIPKDCLSLCERFIVRPNRAVNADAPVRPFNLARVDGGAPVTLIR